MFRINLQGVAAAGKALHRNILKPLARPMARDAEVRAARANFYKDVKVTPPEGSGTRLIRKVGAFFNSPAPAAPAKAPQQAQAAQAAPLAPAPRPVMPEQLPQVREQALRRSRGFVEPVERPVVQHTQPLDLKLNYQRPAPLPRLNAIRPEEAILLAAPKPAPRMRAAQPQPRVQAPAVPVQRAAPPLAQRQQPAQLAAAAIPPNNVPVRVRAAQRAKNEVPIFETQKIKRGTGQDRVRALISDGNVIVYAKSHVQGGFGRFHRAALPDGTQRGLKQVRLTYNEKAGPRKSMPNKTSPDDVVREAAHMRALGMKVYGVHHTKDGKAFIETDLFAGGLTEKLDRVPIQNRAAVARHSLKSMMQQLGSLHAKGSVHRDIKNDNLLFNSDGRVQIADPGLLITREEIARYDKRLPPGTLCYMPPECFGRRSADKPTAGVDVWAAGCAYLQQLTHQWPLVGLSREQMGPALRGLEPERRAYLRGDAPLNPGAPWAKLIGHAHRVDPEGTAFVLERLLEPNPHRRIDAVDATGDLDRLKFKTRTVSRQDITRAATQGLAAAAKG